MKRLRMMLPVLALVVVASGCVATEGTGTRTRTSSNQISADELASMQGQVTTLYQAVTRLRPFWLQGDVVVYQNQSYFGWKQSLEEFGLDSAKRLSYMDRSEAVAQLPGLRDRHIDGAIIIHTR